MADIEYNRQYAPQDCLYIDNMGDVSIEASNDEGMLFYLILVTKRGTSTMLTFGPVVPDIYELPSGYSVQLEEFDFETDKAQKKVSMWLNDRKKITKATIVTVPDALSQLRDAGSYLSELWKS